MKIWIDAQISPSIALWLNETFPGIKATALRDLGLRDEEDIKIFNEAKKAEVIVLTKDSDFPKLQQQFGPPPKIIWITCGNTSNQKLIEILQKNFASIIQLLDSGEILIEISG